MFMAKDYNFLDEIVNGTFDIRKDAKQTWKDGKYYMPPLLLTAYGLSFFIPYASKGFWTAAEIADMGAFGVGAGIVGLIIGAIEKKLDSSAESVNQTQTHY